MPPDGPLVEVDPATLSRSEWAKLVWAVLWRGSRYTLPPLVAILVTVAVFGLVITAIGVTAGLSPEVLATYEPVFEITGDVLSGVIGMYVFARNLRVLPRLHLNGYRFAFVRDDAVS
ncbi:MAG: hypothetical protein SF182_00790 [Deltaproteobacteria bacterium]|nr:hypothetical protein [Deltaproteobacteria bacterium]